MMDFDALTKKIVNQLKKDKRVKAIYLFGSIAKGNASINSDIDLAIITDQITKNDKYDLLGYSSKIIDISIFSDLPHEIQYRVLKEGKLLFKRPKFNLNLIISQTIMLYLDFISKMNKHFVRYMEN